MELRLQQPCFCGRNHHRNVSRSPNHWRSYAYCQWYYFSEGFYIFIYVANDWSHHFEKQTEPLPSRMMPRWEQKKHRHKNIWQMQHHTFAGQIWTNQMTRRAIKEPMKFHIFAVLQNRQKFQVSNQNLEISWVIHDNPAPQNRVSSSSNFRKSARVISQVIPIWWFRLADTLDR